MLKHFVIHFDSATAMTPLTAWQAFGRRAAVVAGTSTALVSLLAHNNLLTASMRGGAALLGVLLVVRVGGAVMTRLPAPSRVEAKRPPKDGRKNG